MRTLSLAIAVFSLLCIGVSPWAPGGATALLGGTGLVAAFTIWRSQYISSFLKIFIGIFAVEVLVFGLGFLADKLGFWPQAWRSFVLPDSLPLSVAIFAILVWAVSHLPVIRNMTRIADGYFETGESGVATVWPFRFQATERRIAIGMIVFLVVVNQAQVGMSVRLSFFNRDWFNAIQTKDEAAFWSLLLFVFTPWAFVYVASAVIEYVVKSMLIIRWRRWLTARYVGRWLDGSTHYRMALTGLNADNPDQRIAEDVNRFIDGGDTGYGIYSYTILLIATVSSLVSFSIILWGLSSNFTLPGTNIAVPGFLFWVALVYAGIGTLVTHLIGRVLVPLFFAKQKYEATFRFSLARLREYGEQVALLSGEHTERHTTMGRFGDVFGNYLRIIARQKILIAFTAFYGQISPIIPYILTAPFYFLGKVPLGVMTQTAGAFGRVEGGLNFFVTYYTSLADFRAVLERLRTFDESIERARLLGAIPPRIEAAIGHVPALEITDLTLGLPDGRTILAPTSLTLRADEPVLVTGPSGSGKSTLFRAIAGIWPYGYGKVAIPSGNSVMLLPQKPYIPIGSLRGAVAYPSEANAYSEAEIQAALVAARLPDFATRLDDEENWAQRLSGGEQQRVAVARALLAKPDWLFLDEATSALDEVSEAAIYRTLAEKLPATTLVSIGHRSTLAAFHKRRIDMQAKGDGAFAPAEVPVAAAAE
jgi:putative ATP-binding cassette transporter